MTEVLMDGYKVEVGDRIFDTRFGWGTVFLTQPGFVSVEFPKNLRYKYTNEGRRGKLPRSLFWQDPVVGAPPKDEFRWNEAKRLMGQVIATFRRIRD